MQNDELGMQSADREHQKFGIPILPSDHSALYVLHFLPTQPSSLPSVTAATSRCLRPPRRTPAQLSALVTPSRYLLCNG